MMRYRGPQGGASIGLGGVSYRTDGDDCIEAPADAIDQLSAHGFEPFSAGDAEPQPPSLFAKPEGDRLLRLKRMGLFKVLRHARIPFEMTLSNDELRAKCREHGLSAPEREP